jgi:hypothetical protein
MVQVSDPFFWHPQVTALAIVKPPSRINLASYSASWGILVFLREPGCAAMLGRQAPDQKHMNREGSEEEPRAERPKDLAAFESHSPTMSFSSTISRRVREGEGFETTASADSELQAHKLLGVGNWRTPVSLHCIITEKANGRCGVPLFSLWILLKNKYISS